MRFAFLLVLLVSCGPTAGPGRPAEPGAFPVTLEHRFGKITLTQVPARVITIGYTDQDAFLALGVVPVATNLWFGKAPGAVFPWAQAQLGGAKLPEILKKDLDYQRIAALRPDLITALYSQLTGEQYSALSAIAPVLAAPAEYPDWGLPWQESVRMAGRAVGRPNEAEGLIRGVDDAFTAARSAHPEFAGRTAAMVSTYGWPDSFYALGRLDGRVRFLQGLGFRNSEDFDRLAGREFGVPVSHDHLGLADRDLVVWLVEAPAHQTALTGDPLWKASRAARENRVVLLPSDGAYYAALSFSSVLSLPYALAGLTPAFQAALDGSSP